MRLLRRHPSIVTPDDAGWTYCGLRIVELAAGQSQPIDTGDTEVIVLPLAGAVNVEVDGERFELAGRESVFTRPSDFVYAGRDSHVVLTSTAGALVAIPSARCERRLPARYGPAGDVPVETRGGGQATRYVRNFAVPDVWTHADKIICCEVITPAGNWSSYPPHKHDASDPCPAADEEIYYFRIAGRDGVTPSREGFGLHRTYTGPEHDSAGLAALDDTFEVRDGDVALVPHGYHGPSVAPPGYPMYYLNVLAGPGEERSMVFCDDPSYAWIREAW